ncbi:MAG TPA: ethanolamine utilization protein EutH [Candidatus Ruthenibacterium merdigallinarum]|nr:ethanolamine utilization protein EutH [Candidatus Ruthenibacterium merdigallinarum]
MNICIAVMLAFALLGAVDKMLSGRLGVAEEFDRGLAMMGSLCMSMGGIYCVAVAALSGASQAIGALNDALPFDVSLPVGMLLATDMGAWPAAKALAATPELAAYTGLLVGATLGSLISFVLPTSLGSLPVHEVMGFMQGVLWGVVALPAGLAAGGLLLGLPLLQLAANWWPVALLCALLVAALRFAPRGCIRVLTLLGEIVRVAGIALFCAVVLGVYVPGLSVTRMELVNEVLVIVLKITAVVCGALVASRLALARCGRFITAAAKRLGVNEYAVLGLMASLVNSVSMLPLYGRMDVRGKVMNAAVCVSGAFLLGGQMAFVSSVGSGLSVAAFFLCKGLGGVLAAALALRFTKNAPAPQP